MDLPLVCPYCYDRVIEAVPGAHLYAADFPQQTAPLAGTVFRCSQWHIFAVFPSELQHGQDPLTG